MNILRSSTSIRFSIVVGTLALAACASMSSAPSAPVKTADGVFVDPKGMTLYTYDKDIVGSGKSVCNGQCAINWPPLFAGDMDKPSGDWSIATRDDGKKQWSWKGKPLYSWIKDTKPGDRTGDGVGNAWRLAKP